MSTTPDRLGSPPARRGVVPDVVAGLLHDGSASAVARAAVREAISRGARVRFVMVVRAGMPPAERASVDDATFAAALRALREAPRVPVSFEVVEGDAGQSLVARCQDAGVLVVARDGAAGTTDVAEHCQRHARCDVLTVAPSRP